jgi:predicted amidohydrolase
MNNFKVACLQTNTGPDTKANLEMIQDLMLQASIAKSQFVALPEACDFLHEDVDAVKSYASNVENHVALELICKLSRQYNYWTLIGSLTVRQDEDRLANRSFLISPEGKIVAWYNKIHMFDANIPGNESANESDIYEPGNKLTVAETPWGKLGMSICYDVRFPHLYRALAHSESTLLTVPAAFAQITGQAHWHTLLRARAIENGCFVIAPAQTGHHYQKRYSYGHSLIVDPWGEVLADGGVDVGIVLANIDLSKISKAKSIINSIAHDRPFS